MCAWRWALASKIGTSHLRMGTRKQDATSCFSYESKDTSIVCAIVADGAGSAPFGGEGASLVCRILKESVKTHYLNSNGLPSSELVWSWIDCIRDSLTLAAENRSIKKQSFASTLVFLLIMEDKLLVAHIGDGAIVGRKADFWEALSWPENGEYASTTYFITDDPFPNARIFELKGEYDAFALFTDGIEDLALDQMNKVPHSPFFAKMLEPLDKISKTGKVLELSKALGSFLESERVCERTDDDKSLILLCAS